MKALRRITKGLVIVDDTNDGNVKKYVLSVAGPMMTATVEDKVLQC